MQNGFFEAILHTGLHFGVQYANWPQKSHFAYWITQIALERRFVYGTLDCQKQRRIKLTVVAMVRTQQVMRLPPQADNTPNETATATSPSNSVFEVSALLVIALDVTTLMRSLKLMCTASLTSM